jgi:hypothetical protein
VPTLLLITASSPEMQQVRRWRVLNFQQITMPFLAAFVPAHWKVVHIDEVVRPSISPSLPIWSQLPFTPPALRTRIPWPTASAAAESQSCWAGRT